MGSETRFVTHLPSGFKHRAAEGTTCVQTHTHTHTQAHACAHRLCMPTGILRIIHAHCLSLREYAHKHVRTVVCVCVYLVWRWQVKEHCVCLSRQINHTLTLCVCTTGKAKLLYVTLTYCHTRSQSVLLKLLGGLRYGHTHTHTHTHRYTYTHTHASSHKRSDQSGRHAPRPAPCVRVCPSMRCLACIHTWDASSSSLVTDHELLTCSLRVKLKRVYVSLGCHSTHERVCEGPAACPTLQHNATRPQL